MITLLRLVQISAASFFTLFLVACSSDLERDFNSSARDDATSGGNVNGSLRGRIYVADNGSYLDVRSGRTVNVGGSFLRPSKDGLEYVSVDQDIEYRDVADCRFGQEFDRVSIYNAATGEVVDSFELPADIWAVSLSPNRQWVGAFYKDDTVCFDEETAFTVFSRTGEVVFRARPDSINSFDWLPDNRLVISLRGGISVEETPGSLQFNQIADLTGVFGNPAKINVDPTGTQVLFEMWTASNNFLSTVQFREATVWSVNIDGSSLRQRVTSTRSLQAGSNSDPQVNAPTWSPDGNWFLVTEGYTSGGVIDGSTASPGIIAINNNGVTYVVSANAEPIDLPEDSNSSDSASPLLRARDTGSVGPIRLEPFGRHTWVPSPGE